MLLFVEISSTALILLLTLVAPLRNWLNSIKSSKRLNIFNFNLEYEPINQVFTSVIKLDFPPFTNTLLATLARKVFFTIVTQTSATSSPPSPVVYQLTSASLDGMENSFLLMLNKFKSCVNYC